MDVEKTLLVIALLSAFSLIFSLIFLKPSKSPGRAKLVWSNFSDSAEFFGKITQLGLAALVFGFALAEPNSLSLWLPLGAVGLLAVSNKG